MRNEIMIHRTSMLLSGPYCMTNALFSTSLFIYTTFEFFRNFDFMMSMSNIYTSMHDKVMAGCALESLRSALSNAQRFISSPCLVANIFANQLMQTFLTENSNIVQMNSDFGISHSIWARYQRACKIYWNFNYHRHRNLIAFVTMWSDFIKLNRMQDIWNSIWCFFLFSKKSR